VFFVLLFSVSLLTLNLDSRPRRAMTLVELLITILIIAILASLVLGVASVATETAREAKTRTMITKLHTLLMQQYDSYKTRRVNVRQEVITGIDDALPTEPGELGYDPRNPTRRGQDLALARLYALREMVLMEMPDRWSDVLLNNVPSPPATAVALYPVYLEPRGGSADKGPMSYRTPLGAIYLREYLRIADPNWKNKLTGAPNTQQEILRFQSAECLYMIIMYATGDGEARSLFSESEIGDVDGDGAPEFLDGWGHPIGFLRWAPGFDSQIQICATTLGDPSTQTGENNWRQAASRDHDPLDLFRVDPLAFRMVPLVFSAGRDEVITTRRDGTTNEYETYGMAMPDPDAAPWVGLTASQLNLNFVPADAPLEPNAMTGIRYDGVTVYAGQDVYVGTGISDRPSVDNIHNHLISTR
jgi:prepilin-type N-terminal cleavage/methylation domain-containing protein